MPTYSGTLREGTNSARGLIARQPKARKGWGLEPVTMHKSGAISLHEARKRIKNLKSNVRENATRMLYSAAALLHAEWRYNIDAMGWGPSGTGVESELGLRAENLERLESAGTSITSTGRYYNSVQVEVSEDLEVHVGSTIPRPSGRGLTSDSYPELLEYGTSQFEAMPTLRPALDSTGKQMEEETERVFRLLLTRFLINGSAAPVPIPGKLK